MGDATIETYERAGFGGRIVPGLRPAVVVIDLNRGFTEPEWPIGGDLTDVVAATARLIEAARPLGAPVVFTTIAYDEADVAGGVVWLRKARGLAILREGSEPVAIDPRLPREPTDPLIAKRGASGFAGTALASVLAGFGVDTVLMCGTTTSGCVRASVVDAVQSGFQVLVPRECVGDRAQGPHEANLFDIDQKYGDVIALEQALDYLHGLAAGSELADV